MERESPSHYPPRLFKSFSFLKVYKLSGKAESAGNLLPSVTVPLLFSRGRNLKKAKSDFRSSDQHQMWAEPTNKKERERGGGGVRKGRIPHTHRRRYEIRQLSKKISGNKDGTTLFQ